MSYTQTALANGRYSHGTTARVVCDPGFQIYGNHIISCTLGSWNELVDGYKCIPADQGELSLSVYLLTRVS